MQIVFHLGAHCTDEGGVLKCLTRNRAALAEEGIAVPDPARYPNLLREALAKLEGKVASEEVSAALIDDLLGDVQAERIVMSYESFMALPRWALGRGMLYPGATERTAGLANLFPGHEVEFHLAIRNLATYLPTLFEKQKGKSYEDFIEGSDPVLLRWSDLVGRIRTASPLARLTVWCDEDTPLIFPEVMRQVSGHGAVRQMADTDGILAAIMTPDGVQRMRAYLAQHPPQSEQHRRRIVTAFLDKFARPEAIEVELDMPGWTDAYVEDLTRVYDEDCALIAGSEGVTFIAP
ncbi:MAG: hypothetical protein Q7J57_02910 [Gemmobacter sp.]|nr:hypothetical protein [Gemmobacter sp.]